MCSQVNVISGSHRSFFRPPHEAGFVCLFVCLREPRMSLFVLIDRLSSSEFVTVEQLCDRIVTQSQFAW